MYLYYTNSRRGTFARFIIDANGLPIPGTEAELVAVLPGYEDGEHLWDDFDFDFDFGGDGDGKGKGDAFVTAHPSSLIRVDAVTGEQTTVVGGDGTDVLIAPTSVEFDTTVERGGGRVLFIVGMGGQVVRVELLEG